MLGNDSNPCTSREIPEMAKRKPVKPSKPLTTIVFRPGDGVHMVSEFLPPTQEDIEAVIVRKFLRALREYNGQELELVERADPNAWPDFEGTLNGHKVGIELVEVISPDHARKRSRQRDYLRELVPHVTDLAPMLRGICLTIDDGYQEPLWPRVNTREGRALLAELAANIRSAVPQLQGVGPRGGHLVWTTAPRPHTGVLAMRGQRIAGAPTMPIDLSFQGAYLPDATVLATIVAGKIAEGYTAYPGGDLCLLAYGDGMVTDSNAISLARLMLAKVPHPFAVVWSFFPLPGQDGGLLEILHSAPGP